MEQYILPTEIGGFANKIYQWSCAWALSNINNMTVVIDWKGDYSYLNLPNTKHISEIPSIKFVDIDSRKLDSPYILQPNNYKLTCGWDFKREIYYDMDYNIFSEIGLNHPVINDIKKLTEDDNLYGIHIRRGDFTKYKNDNSDFSKVNTQIHDRWFIKVMRDIREKTKMLNFIFRVTGEKTN